MRLFRQFHFQNEKFNLLLIGIIAFAVMLPILLNGLPRGVDMPHHYQCALTFYQGFLNGDFYPSWTLDRNLGYGAMELRLYPPVSHYILALFYVLLRNWHLATWLTFTFWAVLGSFGMYFWAREYVSPRDAAFAAALYALAPYNLHRVYLIFFYSEYAASAILPFCFAFVARLARRNQKSTPSRSETAWLDVIGLTVSIAAIILTHLPVTVIGLSALALYSLLIVHWDFRFCLRYFVQLLIAVLVALSATSFFWIKVLQERFLMAKADIYDQIIPHYENNFLLTAVQSYDERTEIVYQGVTLFADLVLLATLAAIGLSLIGLLKNRSAQNSRLWLGVGITFAITLFLCLIPSKPLWDALPLLQEVQFPWRWLTVVTLCITLLAARGVKSCFDWFKDKSKRPLALIAVGLLLFAITFTLKQIVGQALYISASDGESFVENVGNDKGFEFWWTIWTRKEIFDIKNKVLAGERSAEIHTWMPTVREFDIAPGEPTTARIAVFYHPNWQVIINGLAVEPKPDENGALTFDVHANSSSVKISFDESRWVKVMQCLSGATWLIILLFSTAVVQRKFSRIMIL